MSSEPAEGQQVEGTGPSPEGLRRQLEEEFNVQRAKMKELFLQKEDELRKLQQENEGLQSEVLGLREQLDQLHTLCQNQKSEIDTLQLIVNETVEASSSGSEEARRLRARNLDLEQQLGHLRHQAQQQEVSLAPATLVRTLARKLGADSDEQTTKKNSEDAECMLQSLEQEVAALKHKLRETDAQLQELLKAKSAAANTTAAGDSNDTEARQCDMCANYEKQLVCEQANARAARDRAAAADTALKQAVEELEGVRRIHEETLRSWRAGGGDTGEAGEAGEAAGLRGAVAAAAARVAEAEAAAAAAAERALALVTALTVDRQTLQGKLDALERDNAMLIGRYLKKAEEIQNEVIDLPDNVEELQVLSLQLRQQLIVCSLGREEALAAETELRQQLLQHAALLHRLEQQLAAAQAADAAHREEIERLQTELAQLQELGDKLRHSNDMIEKLLDDKKRLQEEASTLRGRVSVLQQELDNSEKVQQDFVRLSQSLQVQLQRFREADTEVRWQHDDDVTQCPSCHAQLNSAKKKVHCRHCGRIFCGACVAAAVASGPRAAPARVCAVCYTLLRPHAKPYFSTQPPRSPD